MSIRIVERAEVFRAAEHHALRALLDHGRAAIIVAVVHAGALGHFLIADAGLVHIQTIASIDVPGPDARLAQPIDEAFDNVGVSDDSKIKPFALRRGEVGLDGKFIGETLAG